MSLTSRIIQRGKELRGYPDDIDRKLASLPDNEGKKFFLLQAADLFTLEKGNYSITREELMEFIALRYSETFEDSAAGYFDFFKKTHYFCGEDKMPISFAIQNKVLLDDICSLYLPCRNNVEALLKEYPMKKIVTTYAKKRKKTEVIGVLMDLGMSYEDFEKAKIHLSQKQYDELIGW